jgi:hypothetical protein
MIGLKWNMMDLFIWALSFAPFNCRINNSAKTLTKLIILKYSLITPAHKSCKLPQWTMKETYEWHSKCKLSLFFSFNCSLSGSMLRHFFSLTSLFFSSIIMLKSHHVQRTEISKIKRQKNCVCVRKINTLF